MLLWRIGGFVLGLAISAPAAAQSDLENGFNGALRGCEQWILEPESWSDGPDKFAARLGLGDKAGWVRSVDDAVLPPEKLRIANRYFRVNSALNAGYVLIVSDRIPMCHITGGGGTDLQPIVETVLASTEFGSRWERVKEQSKSDLTSTVYRSLEDPKFKIVISRARQAGERLDRVQVLATATYDLGH